MSKPQVLNTNGLGALLKVEISKSVGALLEVEMSKKCASLWREARSQAKSVTER